MARAGIGSLALAVLAAGAFQLTGCEKKSSPPVPSVSWAESGSAAGFNVLLITLDTLRPDRLGCYGHPPADTPVLDALAGGGVRFDDAVATAPLTLPSHASIHTGLDVPNHGVRNNGDFKLTERHVTLAERLGQRGYATAGFVSAFVLDGRYGLDQGFDVYGDSFEPKARKPGWGADLERPANEVTDEVLKWMRARSASDDSAPFFAWVHYYDAHADYEPPPMFAQRFANDLYDGEIAFVDQQIGRVIGALERLGVRNSTVTIVVGDHGESLGEHGEATHGHLIYDSSMRVPLILNAPGVIAPHRVIDDRVASTIDVVPTLLDLLGVPIGDTLDGVSQLRSPADGNRAVYMESLLPLLNHGWSSLHALRRHDAKFIDAPRAEFYDLTADPRELSNLYHDAPPAMAALVQALDERMTAWDAVGGDAEAGLAMDPETLAKLESLGYINAGSDHGGAGERDPKDMMPIWQEMVTALNLSESGGYAEALVIVERSLKAWPGDVFVLERKADILMKMKRLAAAEKTLREVLRIKPAVTTYVTLGQILIEQSRYDELEILLRQAEVIDPAAGAVLILRGDVAARHQRLDEALKLYEEAVRRDPKRSAAMARAHARQVRAFRAQQSGDQP